MDFGAIQMDDMSKASLYPIEASKSMRARSLDGL